MFKDFDQDFLAGGNFLPPPAVRSVRKDRKPPPPARDPRREKIVIALVGFNALMLFFAPIAGVTIFDWAACYF